MNTALLNRLRQSWLYTAYWSWRRPEIIARRDGEVNFYRAFVKPGALVFDIGANHGQKTDVFLRAGAGRVVAVDPDPFNIDTLMDKFWRYRRYPLPVEIRQKAISSRKGRAKLNAPFPGSALASITPVQSDGAFTEFDCLTVTLDQFVLEYGLPAFIKIDVEGHELQVLQGLSRPVPLSFEVNLPENRAKGEACMVELERKFPEGEFSYIVECADGLQSGWRPYAEFLKVYARISAPSIEVFWRPAP